MARRTVRVMKKRNSLKKRSGAIGKKSKVQRKKGSRRRVRVIRGGNPGKNMLLIIDPQQDFVDENVAYGELQIHDGTLTVTNASADLNRVVEMLQNNPGAFDEIHVSLDTHTKTHIAHAGFWDTNPPLPMYTALTAEGDIINPIFKAGGENVTLKNPKLNTAAFRYLTALVKKNKDTNGTVPPPIIWKDHCLYVDEAGNSPTEGWKLYKPLADLLSQDKFKNKVFFHEKGTNDLVEMYSIFSSEIPFSEVAVDEKERNQIFEVYPDYEKASVPTANQTVNKLNNTRNYNTDFNKQLFTTLMGDKGENKVFVCGEAKSHCVKTSLEDMVKNCDNDKYKASQIHAFTDMMSPIPTFENTTQTAFDNLEKSGVKMVTLETFANELIPVPSPANPA